MIDPEHLDVANDLSVAYEYLKMIRRRLNQREGCNEGKLLSVDVRTDLVLRQLKAAILFLRSPQIEPDIETAMSPLPRIVK